MDEFGVLTERYGLKPQGKSAPMSASKLSTNPVVSQARNFPSHAASVNAKSFSYSSSSTYNSNSVNGSFLDDHDSLFGNPKPQNFGDGFDVFRDFQKNSSGRTSGSSFDYDSIFAKSRFSSAKSSFDNDDDDIFGLNSSNSARNNDDIFGSFASKPKPNAQPDDLLGNFAAKTKTATQNGSVGFDDLIPGFGSSSASGRRDNIGITTSSFSSPDDPFAIFESTSTTMKSTFTDPLEEFSKPNHSGSSKPNGSSKFSSPLSPPPRPGQVLKADKVKSSDASAIDELEDFAMGRVRNNGNGHSDVRHAKEVRNTQSTKSSKYKEAEDAARQTQQKSPDDLESFFGMGSRSTSVPKSRATTLDTMFDGNLNNRGKPEVGHKQSFAASSGIKKASSTTNIVDDLSSIFGDAELFGEFEEVEGETEERRRARLGRHQRTQDRVARAVADMNQRELQTQHEQEERRRIADNVDVVIKRWAAGKEGNMRALLSSLHYVLWPECGWEPVSLTDLITSTSVKKVYRKATLCVHPDKVQQKGAILEQKYTAEKVFDILKEAWNKFNKEELS